MRSTVFAMACGSIMMLGTLPGTAAAGSAEVGASVSLLEPARINARQASDLLLSTSTGVLTIRFPTFMKNWETRPVLGQPCWITLDALKLQCDGGTYIFSVGAERAQELDEIVASLAAPLSINPVKSGDALTAQGYIDGKGFQMAVVQIVRTRGGGGYIHAVIPFN